jgi:branched-chain amino acid transport system permease protein
MSHLQLSFWLALPAAIIIVVLVSLVLERLLYRRLYGGGELDQVLMTMGLIFMTVGAATYFWGPVAQPIHPPDIINGQIHIGSRDFPTYRSFLIVCGVVLVTALWLALERTRFGAQVRAAVDNLRMAQSVGINTSRLFALTFALGSALAALGGALGADFLPIVPGYALGNLVLFLIVVAVGGLGSIRGPFVAALLIGISLTAFSYIAPELGAFFIYALTMAILLWKPRGLFGRS